MPRGTGAVVTDPHEIANVAGLPGIAALRAAAAGLPLHVRVHRAVLRARQRHESPGAVFDLAEIAEMLSWPETVALGELMNFPGCSAPTPAWPPRSASRPDVAATAMRPDCAVHALQAYAGSGPGSDHESTTP